MVKNTVLSSKCSLKGIMKNIKISFSIILAKEGNYITLSHFHYFNEISE